MLLVRGPQLTASRRPRRGRPARPGQRIEPRPIQLDSPPSGISWFVGASVRLGLAATLAAMQTQAATKLADPRPHPSCRKVLASLQEHWTGRTRFVDDVGIPLDNSASERRQRGRALGRKNYYGSGALRSGRLRIRSWWKRKYSRRSSRENYNSQLAALATPAVLAQTATAELLVDVIDAARELRRRSCRRWYSDSAVRSGSETGRCQGRVFPCASNRSWGRIERTGPSGVPPGSGCVPLRIRDGPVPLNPPSTTPRLPAVLPCKTRKYTLPDSGSVMKVLGAPPDKKCADDR